MFLGFGLRVCGRIGSWDLHALPCSKMQKFGYVPGIRLFHPYRTLIDLYHLINSF